MAYTKFGKMGIVARGLDQ